MKRVTCDICGKLLLPNEKETPDSMKTHFESVRIFYLINQKAEIQWDLCPRCVKRMKRYLQKEGWKMDD